MPTGKVISLQLARSAPGETQAPYNAPQLSNAFHLVFYPLTLDLPVWVLPPMDAVMSPANTPLHCRDRCSHLYKYQ